MCVALISVLYVVSLFISLLSPVLPLRLVGLRSVLFFNVISWACVLPLRLVGLWSVLLFVVISWVCLSSTLCNSFISFQ